MGYDFTQGASKKDVVTEQIQSSENTRTLAHKVVREDGTNVLWAVKETTQESGGSMRWIYCGLMYNKKGFGWGYKGMDEICGPFYYSCPMKFLDLAPTQSILWRGHVRVYAEQHPSKARRARK